MKINYSTQNEGMIDTTVLETYREKVRTIIDETDFTQNESSLATWRDEDALTYIQEIKEALGEVTDVILIGIGGSSLGTEAIHAALKFDGSQRLHVLDSVAEYRISEVLSAIQGVEREKLAICAISKSGGTTETVTNTSIILRELGEVYGDVPYDRTVFIGNPGNQLLKIGEELGCYTVPMQEVVGGRYSVFTTVGLIPLALLGHDTDAILEGVEASVGDAMEHEVARGATQLFTQIKSGIHTVNFFAFDTRLEKLGRWYRQLTAESLGKEEDRDGNSMEIGFIPVMSTPVELHSIGQLYFSGFKGVYTDFVSIAVFEQDRMVKKDTLIATTVAGKSMYEIAQAIEGGVLAAYDTRTLPYRKTELAKLDEKELGLFMGTRMLETMYVACLMNVDAFNQPNVELYKDKTREILGN